MAKLKPNPDAAIAGIDKMIAFLTRWGDRKPERIAKYRELAAQIKERGLKRDLFRELDKFRNDNFVEIRFEIWDGHVLAGKDSDETIEEMQQASGAIYSALFPLDIPQTVDISPFAGSEHVHEKRVECPGDLAGAREVVEKTIALVRRYSQTVGQGELEAAYSMTDRGLRAMMKPSQFVRKHREADGKWGKLREFHMSRFTFILTDAAARERKDLSKDWEELTPKQNRRAHLLGYWHTDGPNDPGGALSIAQENGQYRVSNFKFWEWEG